MISEDGNWGEWASWGACDCEAEHHTRHRQCDSPPQLNGGEPCLGGDTDIKPCEPELHKCPRRLMHGKERKRRKEKKKKRDKKSKP